MNEPFDENGSAQKIAVQHRLIESLFDGLGTALSARDGGPALRRTAGLQRALDAHFLLEERHYFPRMRDERPEREPDLQRLVEEHVNMRLYAGDVSAHLARAEWEAAARTFETLQSFFHRHEAFERKIVDP